MQFCFIRYIDIVNHVCIEGAINTETSLNRLNYYGFLSQWSQIPQRRRPCTYSLVFLHVSIALLGSYVS